MTCQFIKAGNLSKIFAQSPQKSNPVMKCKQYTKNMKSCHRSIRGDIYKTIFLFQNKTYVVGTQKNHLNEMVLLGTHNICLDWSIKNNYKLKLKRFAETFCSSGPIYKTENQSIFVPIPNF